MRTPLRTFWTGILLILFVVHHTGLAVDKKQGVYEQVLEKVDLAFDVVVHRLDSAFAQNGFTVLAAIPNGVPEGCPYQATVLAVYQPEYGKQLLAMNQKTAPYAVVDRIIVFEDERGVHVAIVNPISILRTVLMDDTRPLNLADQHRQLLRNIIINGVQAGTPTEHQYGQFRKKGYIGRTMGVMAGGPFDEKIETITTMAGTLESALQKLQQAFQQHQGDWNIRVKYILHIPEAGIAVVGVSSPSIEERSYRIVGAGSDKSRKDFQCPGIAHAGAYPMEVVLRENNGQVTAEVVDIMYRMKMYFEDAGKWAFAKNMTMPGSIQSEIETVVKQALR